MHRPSWAFHVYALLFPWLPLLPPCSRATLITGLASSTATAEWFERLANATASESLLATLTNGDEIVSVDCTPPSNRAPLLSPPMGHTPMLSSAVCMS